MKHEVLMVRIEEVLLGMKEFLKQKNLNYGNSATEPVRVFSASGESLGMLVRMDDKLSRIRNSVLAGNEPRRNDIIDLLGYLVIYSANKGWTDFKDLVD